MFIKIELQFVFDSIILKWNISLVISGYGNLN